MAEMLNDYAVMREQARACLSPSNAEACFDTIQAFTGSRNTRTVSTEVKPSTPGTQLETSLMTERSQFFSSRAL